MSKKHRKRHNAVSQLTTRPLTSLIVPPKPPRFSQIEDRREHHPLGAARPARQLSGHPVKSNKIKNTKIQVRRGPQGKPLKSTVAVVGVPSRIRFAVPKRTIICLKRKIRQEVLHAFKRTGKGASRKRHARRNAYSHVSC